MTKPKKKLYLQQKKRYLKKIIGSIEKPRLSVFRSRKHIYAQLIDDSQGKTLAFSSTLEKEISGAFSSSSTKDASFVVGQQLAKKAKEQNLNQILFDRGSKPYHGRIQSLADGARSEGLVF